MVDDHALHVFHVGVEEIVLSHGSGIYRSSTLDGRGCGLGSRSLLPYRGLGGTGFRGHEKLLTITLRGAVSGALMQLQS